MTQLLAAVAALNYVAVTRIDADKTYLPGARLMLTDEHAKALLAAGAIKLAEGEQVQDSVNANELDDGAQALVDMNIQLEDEKADALKKLGEAQQAHAELSADFTRLQDEHKALTVRHEELQTAHAVAIAERDALKAQAAETPAPAAAKATTGAKGGK